MQQKSASPIRGREKGKKKCSVIGRGNPSSPHLKSEFWPLHYRGGGGPKMDGETILNREEESTSIELFQTVVKYSSVSHH